mmetsp:Transcript_11224/g.30224  ORF Transcript_11224/g.30224 Transcript_11224/m.30224 type:complete len:93 (-) Transcript_11224:459-737(-)
MCRWREGYVGAKYRSNAADVNGFRSRNTTDRIRLWRRHTQCEAVRTAGLEVKKLPKQLVANFRPISMTHCPKPISFQSSRARQRHNQWLQPR